MCSLDIINVWQDPALAPYQWGPTHSVTIGSWVQNADGEIVCEVSNSWGSLTEPEGEGT